MLIACCSQNITRRRKIDTIKKDLYCQIQLQSDRRELLPKILLNIHDLEVIQIEGSFKDSDVEMTVYEKVRCALLCACASGALSAGDPFTLNLVRFLALLTPWRLGRLAELKKRQRYFAVNVHAVLSWIWQWQRVGRDSHVSHFQTFIP